MKPVYKIPSMNTIKAIPWNGFNVVSTFSGAGGSCLGYRMAGYRVLWANEFIPAAQEVYKLNHPNSILDNSDDLFYEYARILRELQPKVFIAENVSGLIMGTAKGYFKKILQNLKDSGYNTSAKLLDSKWMGVPQSRKRLIFIGVRNDLALNPIFPKPLPYSYTLSDAIPEKVIDGLYYLIPPGKMPILYEASKNIRGKAKGSWDKTHQKLYGKASYMNHRTVSWDLTPPTIVQSSMSLYHPDYPRSMTIPELKRIQSLPDDFQLTGSLPKQWERIGRMVPPIMMKHIAQTVRDEILCQMN